MPCLLPSSGGAEWSRHEDKRISTSRQRAVVRGILTEKQRPRETHSCKNRKYQRIGSKTFSVDRFSRVTNFGCEQRKVQKTLATIPSRNAHLKKRVLDIGRTQNPVLSVLRCSLKFHMTESLSCEQKSTWTPQKLSVACARIKNEPMSPSLLGNEKSPTCSTASSTNLTEPALTRSRTKPTQCRQLCWKTGST